MQVLFSDPGYVLQRILEHIEIVGIAVLIALFIGVPTGIAIVRLRWLEATVVNTASVLYTVPSLALFAILIPFTGLGVRPAVMAVILYSLLVIIRNTIAGIDSVDPAMVDAARGMGMTAAQRLALVELPLGLPVIVAGARVAAVSGIGIATVAAYVGAGGLGILIFDGIRTLDAERVILGALSTSVLALLADWGLLRLERFLSRGQHARVSSAHA